MKLEGRITISGRIETLTGLHIGGSKEDVEIGGVDNGVIKTMDGQPYIPGSSLKGKLRYLLEMSEGKDDVCKCGEEECSICRLFGVGADKGVKKTGPTRIKVRDSYLAKSSDIKNDKCCDFEYEVKKENSISRSDAKAVPRPIERVPAGTSFGFNIVVDLFNRTSDIEAFEELIFAMCLLEDDYLGGSGSRGYGQVKFKDIDINYMSLKDLKNISFEDLKSGNKNNDEGIEIRDTKTMDMKEILKEINEIEKYIGIEKDK